MTGIFCAIDAANMQDAQDMVRKLSNVDIGIKIGLELFVAEGPFCVERLRELKGDTPVFLDLKLHDIPNTVAGSIRAAVRCRADFITIHTSGGAAMMRTAIEAAQDAAAQLNCPLPALLGVTVLTHMDDGDLESVGQHKPAGDQVLRLAQLADMSGLQGVICSPLEIASLRKNLSSRMKLVVPGIRPEGSAAGDQKRTLTPQAASQLGADYLVIGRPITQSADPAKAAQDILDSLARKAA